MSENTENNEHHGDGHDDGHHVNYFAIYVALVVLFLISVAGPEIGELTGLRIITIITAFGVAIVKANLVINNFMHLKWEKRIMKWMLTATLILVGLMVAGVSPDVMNHEGRNWENLAAKEAASRDLSGEHGAEEAEGEGEGEMMAEGGGEPAGFSAATQFGTICATCHGAAGEGNGPAGVALDPPPANFTDPAFWEGRDRERIITVIRDGAAAVGGSPLMAPWGALFNEEQLELMADYVMEFRPE
jgi:caa(3)-type oxidase subunit IV